MKIYSLALEGFRRVAKTEVLFGDATFLIGENNSGKSTILKAIEYLLSVKKVIPSQEYYSVIDEETGETKPAVNIITFEAQFRNLPEDAVNWRGFKGRVFSYATEDENDTGLSVTYRKTFELGKDVVTEFKSKVREIKEQYVTCLIGQDYIDNGIDAELILELFPDLDKKIGRSKGALEKIGLINEIWDLKDDEEWFQNPGGIPGNVLKMLPRFLLIPADTSINEIEGGTTGVLGKTLNELFEDVRESSENYKQAQLYLNELSKELDPKDEGSEFGKMITELNSILI